MDPIKQSSPMAQPEENPETAQQVTEPINPVVPEPVQPVALEPISENKPKKPDYKILIIAIIAVVLMVIAVIAGLVFGGVIKFGDDSSAPGQSNDNSPSPELAKSVCEKNGGDYSIKENSHYCENENGNKPFSYIISFSDQERIDDFRELAKSSLINELGESDGSVTILENSDEFIKLYASPSIENDLEAYVFSAVYKDAMVELEVLDGVFGEDLLAELGFPDRNRGSNYDTSKKKTMRSLESAQSDTEYRDVLSKIIFLTEQFQANNNGQLPTISNGSLVGFDEYLEDDKYSIVGFESFADSEFAEDDTAFYDIPSDQIYAFYNAECNNDVIVTTDKSRSVALIHSNADHNGYFCYSN